MATIYDACACKWRTEEEQLFLRVPTSRNLEDGSKVDTYVLGMAAAAAMTNYPHMWVVYVHVEMSLLAYMLLLRAYVKWHHSVVSVP